MREAGKYLRDGLLRLNAPLCLHPRPSTSPPPLLCSRRRYEKVIMFPLEMTRSPSAPFISKWNNLSTVAFFFLSLHLHLSFLYTTPAPLFLSFTSLYSLPRSPLPFLISSLNFFLFFGVERGVGACIISQCIRYGAPTSIVSHHTYHLLCKVGIKCACMKRLFVCLE